ncbi:hypothetical protein Y032_0017g3384 [Ancylostoma ceylanicum]|uniref:CCHC-type domain-containing protein n=1 Tax=Ancylostoma ceylanicum TaxID=53326 RepID=A0A016V671_9BILA|nr:hypothetical protein Y032_0017g3384 [Ancylostoma ceylanicum]
MDHQNDAVDNDNTQDLGEPRGTASAQSQVEADDIMRQPTTDHDEPRTIASAHPQEGIDDTQPTKDLDAPRETTSAPTLEGLDEERGVESAQSQEETDDASQQAEGLNEEHGAESTQWQEEAGDASQQMSAQPREKVENLCPQTEDLDEQREFEMIEGNVEFMEGVDEAVNEHDDADIDEDQMRRHQLELELARARQALRDLHSIILDLENQPTCAARRIHHGTTYRDGERFLRCAFCPAMGIHYSDSCPTVMDTTVRKQMVQEKRKCELCLETFCAGDRECKKWATPCYHCRRYGHHSALCDLPERSQQINERLANARRSYQWYEERIKTLEDQLRQYRDH